MKYNKKLLLATLSELPNIIEMYVSNIPVEVIDIKRTSTAWTIREHIYHIVSVQQLLYERIDYIRTSEKAIITPFFPENQVDTNQRYKNLDAAFNEYKALRKRQITLLKKLSTKDFLKEAEHGEYTQYNIPIVLNHMISHEYWHMYRIEELWITNHPSRQ